MTIFFFLVVAVLIGMSAKAIVFWLVLDSIVSSHNQGMSDIEDAILSLKEEKEVIPTYIPTSNCKPLTSKEREARRTYMASVRLAHKRGEPIPVEPTGECVSITMEPYRMTRRLN